MLAHSAASKTKVVSSNAPTKLVENGSAMKR